MCSKDLEALRKEADEVKEQQQAQAHLALQEVDTARSEVEVAAKEMHLQEQTRLQQTPSMKHSVLQRNLKSATSLLDKIKPMREEQQVLVLLLEQTVGSLAKQRGSLLVELEATRKENAEAKAALEADKKEAEELLSVERAKAEAEAQALTAKLRDAELQLAAAVGNNIVALRDIEQGSESRLQEMDQQLVQTSTKVDELQSLYQVAVLDRKKTMERLSSAMLLLSEYKGKSEKQAEVEELERKNLKEEARAREVDLIAQLSSLEQQLSVARDRATAASSELGELHSFCKQAREEQQATAEALAEAQQQLSAAEEKTAALESEAASGRNSVQGLQAGHSRMFQSLRSAGSLITQLQEGAKEQKLATELENEIARKEWVAELAAQRERATRAEEEASLAQYKLDELTAEMERRVEEAQHLQATVLRLEEEYRMLRDAAADSSEADNETIAKMEAACSYYQQQQQQMQDTIEAFNEQRQFYIEKNERLLDCLEHHQALTVEAEDAREVGAMVRDAMIKGVAKALSAEKEEALVAQERELRLMHGRATKDMVQELKSLQTMHQRAKQEYEELREFADLEAALVKEHADELEVNNKKLASELEQVQDSLRTAQEQVRALTGQAAALQEDCQAVNGQLEAEKAERQVASLEAAKAAQTEMEQALAAREAEAKAREQDLLTATGIKEARIAKLSEDLARVTAAEKLLSATVGTNDEHIRTLQEQLRQEECKQAELAHLLEETKRAGFEARAAEIRQLEEQMHSATAEKETEVAEVRRELAQVRTVLEESLSGITDQEKAMADMRSKVVTLEAEKRRLEGLEMQLRGQLAEAEGYAQELEEMVREKEGELNQAVSERARAKGDSADLRKREGELKGVVESLRGELRVANERAQDAEALAEKRQFEVERKEREYARELSVLQQGLKRELSAREHELAQVSLRNEGLVKEAGEVRKRVLEMEGRQEKREQEVGKMLREREAEMEEKERSLLVQVERRQREVEKREREMAAQEQALKRKLSAALEKKDAELAAELQQREAEFASRLAARAREMSEAEEKMASEMERKEAELVQELRRKTEELRKLEKENDELQDEVTDLSKRQAGASRYLEQAMREAQLAKQRAKAAEEEVRKLEQQQTEQVKAASEELQTAKAEWEHKLRLLHNNLRKAEAEVNWLGDENEVLSSALTTVQEAFEYYAGPLQQLRGMSRVLTVVNKAIARMEATPDSVKFDGNPISTYTINRPQIQAAKPPVASLAPALPPKASQPASLLRALPCNVAIPAKEGTKPLSQAQRRNSITAVASAVLEQIEGGQTNRRASVAGTTVAANAPLVVSHSGGGPLDAARHMPPRATGAVSAALGLRQNDK